VPFRHRRRRSNADPVQVAEQRLAAPLARLQERLVTAASSLDTLVADLGDVATQMRQIAEQATDRTGGCSE
jgi:hypothetical protein